MNSQQNENNYPVCADDEIDLVDLFLVLLKHKYKILFVTILCAVLGSVYAFFLPTTYKYTTSIDIGRFYPDGAEGQPTLIEPVGTVQSKLEENYIPSIFGNFANSGKLEISTIKTDVKVPKDSNLLILESKGLLDDSTIHHEAHKSIVNTLINSQKSMIEDQKSDVKTRLERARLKLSQMEDERLFDIRKKALEDQLADAERKLDNLKNQKLFAVKEEKVKDDIEKAQQDLEKLQDKSIFAIKLKALEEQIKNSQRNLASLQEQREIINADVSDLSKLQSMLEADAQRIKGNIEKNLETRAQAAAEADSASAAMTLLLMDNQIQESESRLQQIRQRLEIGLADQRRKLERSLSENSRAIEAAQAKVEQLKLQEYKLNKDHNLEISESKRALDQLQREYNKLIIGHNNSLEEAKQEVAHFKRQLNKLLIDHENSIKEQKINISSLEDNLSLIKETEAIGVAVRSVNPVGSKKPLIVALSLVLGFMGGIFLAFGAEFMAKVRRQQAEMES